MVLGVVFISYFFPLRLFRDGWRKVKKWKEEESISNNKKIREKVKGWSNKKVFVHFFCSNLHRIHTLIRKSIRLLYYPWLHIIINDYS